MDNKLNLQLFADEAKQTEPEQVETGQEKPSFDELLKDKEMQAEFDRRISKALDTAKGKWQKEQEEAIEAARTEAEKLAKMNAEEKAKHEREKREADLARREAELNRRELKAEAASVLTQKGLPLELLGSINLDSAEESKKSIEAVEAAFRAAVQAGVDERLKGKEPPKTSTTTLPTETKNMTYSERAELYARDKEAYERMFGKG